MTRTGSLWCLPASAMALSCHLMLCLNEKHFLRTWTFPKRLLSCAKQRAAGLVKDRLEQSWWPQQVKIDACLGFVPGTLIQSSSQYLKVHQYRVHGDFLSHVTNKHTDLDDPWEFATQVCSVHWWYETVLKNSSCTSFLLKRCSLQIQYITCICLRVQKNSLLTLKCFRLW